MSAILRFFKGTPPPVEPPSLSLSAEARETVQVPLRGQSLDDRTVSVQESASLRSLSGVSGDEAEFKAYFPSVDAWIDVMGCLPSEAFIDETYHNLFNQDYRALKQSETWPGIVNKRDHSGLKLLPLKILEQVTMTELAILDVPLLGLPKDLGQMTGLKNLVIHKTHLRCLPGSVAQLKLKELGVTHSRLIILPDSIFEGGTLNILSVVGNPLDEFSQAQERIFNLKKGITVV